MAQTPIGNNEFFKYNGNLPYLGEKDTAGTMVLPALQYILVGGVFVPVSAANPMPATVGNFPATQTVAGAVTANIGTTGALALDGTDATGVTMPAGGVGIKGWLSGIYSRLLAVLSVKSVDGTGAELFTTANPGQVKLQSSGTTGSAAPSLAQQIAGVKNGTLAVPAVAPGADGMSASLDGLVTTAVMMGSNGVSRDVMRLANVFKTFQGVNLAAGASADLWVPAANKKPRLMAIVIGSSGAGSHIIREHTPAGALVRDVAPMLLSASIMVQADLKQGVFLTAANNKIVVTNNTASAAFYHGVLIGTEE